MTFCMIIKDCTCWKTIEFKKFGNSIPDTFNQFIK